MRRKIVCHTALVILVTLTLLSASTIAQSSNQKPASQQPEISLMTKGQGISDVDVVLKKKPGGKIWGDTRTVKDGSFNFENLPFGTYNLTFAAPQTSPAIAGKVEYLALIEQFEVGGADRSSARTYTDSKSNTAKRIAINKMKDGFDFTVGPQPQNGAINTSKSNIKNSPPTSATRKAKDSNAPQTMKVHGMIFLVKTGTTKMAIEEEGMKVTSAALSEPTSPVSTQKFRLIISFYSIGTGINSEARNRFNKYISSYEKANAVKLAKEEVHWGREGEVDYCLQLKEIRPKEKEKVVLKIKSLLKNAKYVRIEENAPCRNMR